MIDNRPPSVVPEAEPLMTPERWFARYAHTLTLPDVAAVDLGADDPWTRRLAQLVEQSKHYPNLDAFRRKYLDWHERQAVRRELIDLQGAGL